MQVVIDIPEKAYSYIKREWVENDFDSPMNHAMNCIKKSTPLPKGHGNLKDELDLDLFAPSLGTDEYVNDLMVKHNIDYVNGDDEDKVRAFALDLIRSCMNVIETAPTIIDADKESEENELRRYAAKVINRGNCMMCGKKLTEELFFCKECEEKGRK